METPRLLAVDDVRLAAPPELATRVAEFYTDVLGLRMLDPRPEEPTMVFRGYSAVKPRLIVALTREGADQLRGRVTVQVASLQPIEERLPELELEAFTTHSLSYYERRLTILDPAGNRVDLVAYHAI